MLKPVRPVRYLLPTLAARMVRPARTPVAVPAGPVDLQPTLEDILTTTPPRYLCSTHYILVALFLSLIIAASLVKVDIIIAAGGRLTTDAPLIVLQPLGLSIIREIRVKVGDMVHKGDVLATLDPTFTQADQASFATQQAALSARIRRLEAELSGSLFVTQGTHQDEILQLNLYHQRQSQYSVGGRRESER